MAANIQRYFDLSVTQPSADSFVEGAITTNLVPADGYAFQISSLQLQFTSPTNLINGAKSEWSLTRDTKTAVSGLDDPDTLFYNGNFNRLVTSGAINLELMIEKEFPSGIYVVEPVIYFQFDTNLTTVAQTLNLRLYYEQVKLSEVEILRLLNNQ